ncbi:hypothetical protein [Micromonospora yangpuensis]|uniref:Uncharacterized protein n=1 Tax=Micromonospora yangpuensis TaxID=683228 RepID=A0A1C6TVG9_9ACTN|nr:hypothetical protein [Micromonospora yangpuensis]GGM00305.1 hypothetical protein GCM10012279_17350 [Micromonospora yangpuensis]SCL45383.1 hypothetical protein GA0070617_0020 [Micromonospora yangpuensis]SCL45796.1 hypothetical protein GA0070617_0038 [Micromonospora yangpuensis]SCL66078.1 hypothetical protein GA0070617_5952 [Micromonospora yangpuensis]
MSRRTGKPSYLLARPDNRRRLVAVGVGLVAAAVLLGGGIGYGVGRPDATEASIADLRRAETERDVQQIADLTALARQTRDQLSPILTALRPDGPAPDPAQARQWQQTMRTVAEPFANPPSGSTATNVARGGLRSAVDQAAVAVDAYALAAESPAANRKALTDIAVRQATLAATTWSVAATQLDQINIDAGHGHQHVYLDTGQDGGAFTPDHAPEGTGG